MGDESSDKKPHEPFTVVIKIDDGELFRILVETARRYKKRHLK